MVTQSATARPFLIREAGASDLAHVRAWLPEVVGGTPAARLAIATDAASKAVVGVAALRVFLDHVGRFLIYVDPAFRARGCGTALLDCVRETARREMVRSLQTGRSYAAGANDDASNAARTFFEARNLVVSQEILRHRAELKAALAVLERIHQRRTQRLANAQATAIVPAAQVDPAALATFAVRHVGGLPEDVARRLNGYDAAYSPALSLVALVDNEIVGALLAVPQGHNVFIETLAVDVAHRGGGLNLALMHRSAAAAAVLGIQTIEFEHDTRETDIFKLAGRFGATQIGRLAPRERPSAPGSRQDGFC